MLLYGVCISLINKIDAEKGLAFLKELAENGHPNFLENYETNKSNNKENYPNYNFTDWIENYKDELNHTGLAAFLSDAIAIQEGINIHCPDPRGVHYLGIAADVPWYFNNKTKQLTNDAFDKMLKDYIAKVTDQKLRIRWYKFNDDTDY